MAENKRGMFAAIRAKTPAAKRAAEEGAIIKSIREQEAKKILEEKKAAVAKTEKSIEKQILMGDNAKKYAAFAVNALLKGAECYLSERNYSRDYYFVPDDEIVIPKSGFDINAAERESGWNYGDSKPNYSSWVCNLIVVPGCKVKILYNEDYLELGSINPNEPNMPVGVYCGEIVSTDGKSKYSNDNSTRQGHLCIPLFEETINILCPKVLFEQYKNAMLKWKGYHGTYCYDPIASSYEGLLFDKEKKETEVQLEKTEKLIKNHIVTHWQENDGQLIPITPAAETEQGNDGTESTLLST